eukprot:3542475-Lingulodinium_polyedra.AAC.1
MRPDRPLSVQRAPCGSTPNSLFPPISAESWGPARACAQLPPPADPQCTVTGPPSGEEPRGPLDAQVVQ